MQRMLIVDDEPKICNFLGQFFQERGFTVETTTSPLEAVERASATSPEIMLVDIRMHPIDGLEVLRRVRASAPEVHVIIVSAYDEAEIAQQALQLGALDYVTKPLVLNPHWWAERFFWFPPAR